MTNREVDNLHKDTNPELTGYYKLYTADFM